MRVMVSHIKEDKRMWVVAWGRRDEDFDFPFLKPTSDSHSLVNACLVTKFSMAQPATRFFARQSPMRNGGGWYLQVQRFWDTLILWVAEGWPEYPLVICISRVGVGWVFRRYRGYYDGQDRHIHFLWKIMSKMTQVGLKCPEALTQTPPPNK